MHGWICWMLGGCWSPRERRIKINKKHCSYSQKVLYGDWLIMPEHFFQIHLCFSTNRASCPAHLCLPIFPESSEASFIDLEPCLHCWSGIIFCHQVPPIFIYRYYGAITYYPLLEARVNQLVSHCDGLYSPLHSKERINNWPSSLRNVVLWVAYHAEFHDWRQKWYLYILTTTFFNIKIIYL